MKKSKGNKKRKVSVWRRTWLWVVIVVLFVAIGGSLLWYERECQAKYEGDDVRIYMPNGITEEAVADTLRSCLGDDFGSKVYRLWRWRADSPAQSEGSYVAAKGMSVIDIARKLVIGAQDPIRLTFNNIRTMQQLADRVGGRLEISANDFLAACDSVLPAKGFNKAGYPAAFLPDTYEFYWNASPMTVVRRLSDVRDSYWSDERRAKAKALGLTPVQIATLASIVEEESNKADERPKIARLYLNRLNRHMLLQADPTVKYAVGDFGLRRITAKHLGVDSPYNTYKHEGLPPGPIRIVERKTLDAVLDAPMHNYIYMCAKEDFSGYHNFAVTGAEHMANARRYHDALNKRNIR